MSNYNAAAKLTLGLCVLTVLGTIWSLAGLWPLRHLSARESGFDKLENLFTIAPLVLVIWMCFAFAHPKKPLLRATIGTTVWYFFSYLLIG